MQRWVGDRSVMTASQRVASMRKPCTNTTVAPPAPPATASAASTAWNSGTGGLGGLGDGGVEVVDGAGG